MPPLEIASAANNASSEEDSRTAGMMPICRICSRTFSLVIALSSLISPAAIERGRQAGFHDYVAKFDRPGLIAALKEQTAEVKQAA